MPTDRAKAGSAFALLGFGDSSRRDGVGKKLLSACRISRSRSIHCLLLQKLLSQHGVKTSGLSQWFPAAETDGTTEYLAWTQNSRAHRGHFDAFLSRTGDARVKLNSRARATSVGSTRRWWLTSRS